MIWIRKWLNFYINSSVHVALAVFGLTFVALTKFEIEFDLVTLGFNFFATILGYNFVKYFTVFKAKFKNKINTVYGIAGVSFLALLGAIFYGLQLRILVQLLILFFAFLTVLYALPLFKLWRSQEYKSLRFIPGVKVFIIALVWAGVCVLIPVLQNQFKLNLKVWLIFVEFFLIVVVLMIPFEIRDLKYDTKGLKTLPQLLGVKYTKIFGLILCGIVLIIEVYIHLEATKMLVVSAIIALILAGFVWWSSIKRSTLYCSFWVEAIPIFWMLLLF